MERAIPTLCQLLGSKSITDVNESIEFFVVASEFGLQSAIIGVRRMLVLIWSRDTAVRDAVVEAYKGLYLDPVAPNARYVLFFVTFWSHLFTTYCRLEYQLEWSQFLLYNFNLAYNRLLWVHVLWFWSCDTHSKRPLLRRDDLSLRNGYEV